MRRSRLPLASLLLGTLFGCQSDRTVRPEFGQPLAELADGSQVGGNPGLFFLPPIFPDPSGDGDFNPGSFNAELSPVVDICEWNAAATPQCVQQIALFTMTSGPGSTVRLDPTAEHYIVNWHTDQFNLITTATYRITVRGSVGGFPLGFVDVDLAATGKELKNVQTGEFIGLVDGRTLPVKFRIEGDAPCADNPDCAWASVDDNGEDVVTNTGFAAASFPAGWLPEEFDEVLVVIERVAVGADNDCHEGRLLLIQAEGCYSFRTIPDVGEFDELVRVEVCEETGAYQPYMQLFRSDPGETPVALDNVQDFLIDCEGFTGTPEETGMRQRMLDLAWSRLHGLLKAVARWAGPQPLVAAVADEGAGGMTGSFSRIGWAAPATISIHSGDDQTAAPGEPITVAVRVTADHFNDGGDPEFASPPLLSGFEVTFEIVDGTGSVASPTATTDENGVATAQWTLTEGANTLRASARTTNGFVTFTATAGLWDLTIESLTHSPANPTDAADMDFTVVVRNNGQTAAGPFHVVVQVARADGGLCPACGTTTFRPLSLGPGAIVTLSRQPFRMPAGSYVNTATADFHGEIPETNEENNEATDPFRVTAAAPPALDNQIVFSSLRDGGATHIFVMGADGSNPTRLTTFVGLSTEPDVSPDGTKIAFTSSVPGPVETGANFEVFVMNADGSNPVNLTDNATTSIIDNFPAWSPNGQKIAFRSNRDRDNAIFIMDADGSNVTRLTAGTQAAWSPDGSKIAFTSNDNEIFVINVDGSGTPINLTNNAAFDVAPSWSPDGLKIAFWSTRESNAVCGSGLTCAEEIYVMDANGENVVRLTNNAVRDDGPVWSPDGTRIAFMSFRDDNNEIYVMNVDGSNPVNLTNNPANDKDPTWSPRR